MGDELLKKTGAGNLFTVFGEPDVRIDAAGGRVTVRGVRREWADGRRGRRSSPAHVPARPGADGKQPERTGRARPLRRSSDPAGIRTPVFTLKG